MCSTYRACGSSGLITSGGGRDLQQVCALRYPVFLGSTICSHADCHLLHVGAPVRVGGLTVRTGELLHGDANGVTQIPSEIASQVADVAPEFVAAERIVLDYVQSGVEKSIAEFADRSRAMSAAMEALRVRVGHGN
jgi:regulator of RNase E activity RraA